MIRFLTLGLCVLAFTALAGCDGGTGSAPEDEAGNANGANTAVESGAKEESDSSSSGSGTR